MIEPLRTFCLQSQVSGCKKITSLFSSYIMNNLGVVQSLNTLTNGIWRFTIVLTAVVSPCVICNQIPWPFEGG